ncbi:MAG: hypothetical protein KC425_00160 [Anaerolineales bacterium]|nr:hypothetical protein [Anaerolineales bacterium]
MSDFRLQTAVSPANTPYPWHHLRAMRADMLGYLEHLAGQGEFLRIPLGLSSAYFVNHPELARAVLTAQADHLEPFFQFNTRPKNGLPMTPHGRDSLT